MRITVRGKVIARIVPERGVKNAARQRLVALRAKCKVGDVVTPTGARWTAERGRS